MISLSFVIIPSRVNTDGSHTIRLKITNVNTTRYISTPYKLAKVGQFQNGVVIKHPQAAFINQKLNAMLVDYTERLERFPNPRANATAIKKYLEESRRFTGLEDFINHYQEELLRDGRKSYAATLEYVKRNFLEFFPGADLKDITRNVIARWEDWLRKRNYSPTTINIRLSYLKIVLNYAVTNEVVEYKVFPFRGYKIPQCNIRDLCISRSEFHRLRDAEFTGKRGRFQEVARDLFLLSFYCAGINLTDLVDAKIDGEYLTFIRKKTAAKKQCPHKEVSITIQPEARAIINKYITPEKQLDFSAYCSSYESLRSLTSRMLGIIGEKLGFEKRLVYYSARKTFCQFGFELGVPLYVLEYAIGQTIKDAANRPIFNYIKIMRRQADDAIRMIIDYSKEDVED